MTVETRSLLARTRGGELARLKQILDGLNIGRFDNDLSMLLGEPFVLSADEHALFREHGKTIASLMRKTRELYRQSIADPRLKWLLDLFEGSLSEEAKSLSREAARFAVQPPVTYRPDFINTTKLAEIQVQGAELGLLHAIGNTFLGNDVFGPSRLSTAWAEAMRSYTGLSSVRVLFFARHYSYNEFVFLGKVFSRNHDIDVTVLSIDDNPELPDLDGFDLIYWKDLEQWSTYLSGRGHLRKYKSALDLHRKFCPELSCLRSKLNMVLPFHPETRAFFSDAERAIWPSTELLSEETIATLQGLPRSRRRNYVAKFAGQDFKLEGGGKSVSMLGGKEEIDEEVFGCAMNDPCRRPWLVQERIRTRYEVEYLAADGCLTRRDMSARINPLYVQMPDGALTHAGGLALFSSNYKVHGGRDTVVTLMIDDRDHP